MKINFKFNKSVTANNISTLTPDTGEVKNIVFDHITKRIYANNEWFGANPADYVTNDALTNILNGYLPLSGGTMTGPISWGTTRTPNNASLILGSKPIIADNGGNGGSSNDYRYLYRFNSGIELGNHHMYLRLLTDNSTGSAGQNNGSSGDVWHYISSNNEITGTISKYIMLDTRNSSLSAITEGTYANKGYSLKVGYSTANVLGVGTLSPSLSCSASGLLSLSVGGESISTTLTAASAIQVTGQNYFSYGLERTGYDESGNPIDGNIRTDAIKYYFTGSYSTNNIVYDSNYIKITKVDPITGNETTQNNPKKYNLKISLSDSFIQRINLIEEALEQIISFDSLP